MGCIYSFAVSAATHAAEVDDASISISDTTVDIELQLPSEANIWKDASDDLYEVVGEYFDDTDQTLEICALLDSRFRKTMLVVFEVHITLDCDDHVDIKSCIGRSGTREEFARFSASVGEVIISDKFSSIGNKHNGMLERLLRVGQKLDEKLEQTKTRRKVTKTISIGLVTTILTSLGIAAKWELISGPVAVVLAVLSSIPFGWIGKRADSLFVSYEKLMNDEKKILMDMKIARTAMNRGLENIKRHVDGMKDQFEGLVELKLHGDEDECSTMKRRVEEAKEIMEGLVKLCDGCNAETRNYRFLIQSKVGKIKMGDHKLTSV